MKDKVQAIITFIVVSVYCYMVVTGKANMEAFVGLAMYIIKKQLDINEKEAQK